MLHPNQEPMFFIFGVVNKRLPRRGPSRLPLIFCNFPKLNLENGNCVGISCCCKAEVVRRVKFIYGQAEKLGGYIGVSSEILFAFSHCLFIFVQTVPETCFHACLR